MGKLITLYINPNNKYLNKLYFGSEVVATGNKGLDSASIESNNKRAVLHLELTDFNLVFESECPELHRYPEIEKAIGDKEKVQALDTICDLLQISANACKGCPKNPNNS